MKKKSYTHDQQQLRKRAEKVLPQDPEDVAELSAEELQNLFQEFRTHQVELELQNEDLRQTQEELLISQKKYTDLFDFAPVGYLIISDKGLILEANLAIAELLNCPRSELFAKPLSSIFTAKQQDNHYRCRNSLLQTGEQQTCERRLQTTDDHIIEVCCRCSVLADVDGDSGQFRMVITDISKRKKAEEKVRQYGEKLEILVDERTKELKKVQNELVIQKQLAVIGKLSASVAHDIRNPLGTISNSIYFIDQVSDDYTDVRIKKHINIMQKEIHRVSGILNDLLDFSKVNDPVLTKGDINATLGAVVKRLSNPDNITVSVDLGHDLPKFLFDHSQLQRVFQNLLSNAVQAMSNGGELYIATAKTNESIIIQIQDTGPGIADSDIEKIFEPLFTTKKSGVGLGLSIVKSFIDKHNGTIKVESKMGKGTTIRVVLPINEQTEY